MNNSINNTQTDCLANHILIHLSLIESYTDMPTALKTEERVNNSVVSTTTGVSTSEGYELPKTA